MQTPLEQALNSFSTKDEIAKLLGHRSARVRRAARSNPHAAPDTISGFSRAENLEALNPAWLEWMLRIPDSPYVQRLAARHPNTLPTTLERLAMTGFAAEVAQNGNAGLKLLETLFETEALRVFLARNQNLPLKLQQPLSTCDDWEVREALAGNANIHPETVVRLMDDPDWDVQEALANNPLMTPQWLALLAQSDWFATREAVAAHPYAPSDALAALVQDSDEDVRITAAMNANVSSQALLYCAQHVDWRLRAVAATHANTTQDVLDELARDKHPMVVRLARVRGVDTAPLELRRLADFNNSIGRALVASHPNSDAETLHRLAKRSDIRVRGFVATNAKMAVETKELLLRTAAWDVKRLLETIETANAIAPQRLPPDARVRRAIASRTDISPSWAQLLALDPDRGVQLALAANPATPPAVLERLGDDEMVADLIARRDDLPAALGDRLEERDVVVASSVSLPAERFGRLVQRKRMPVRRALALNPKAVESVFDNLLEDVTLDVPRALLRNAALTDPQIRKLGLYRGSAKQSRDVQEGSYIVRQRVAETTQNAALLLEQTKDLDFRVLNSIAARIDCPTEVLRALVKVQLERYRGSERNEVSQHHLFRMLAARSDAPADVLEQLVSVRDAPTQLLIARHHHANAQTLKCLYSSGDDIVRDAVLRHSNTNADLLETVVFAKRNPWVRFLLFARRAQRSRAFAQKLLEVALAADLERFGLVVVHPQVSEQTLRFLLEVTKFSFQPRFVALRDAVRQRLTLYKR